MIREESELGREKSGARCCTFASLFLVGEHVGSQQLVLARLRGMGVVAMKGKHACMCLCTDGRERIAG